MNNAFYFGDNLHILREYIPDESVDLIYLDPPFNSNANYNLLFRSPDKSRWSDAQIATFEDTWVWGEAAEETFDYLHATTSRLGTVIGSLRQILGENDMLAYLTMMAARLLELERVMKPSGSVYLHCDPTASHYLKVLMDAIFGSTNFRNEIIWRRNSAKGLASRRLPTNHDTILGYSGSDSSFWNEENAFRPYDLLDLPPKTKKQYSKMDSDGRRYQLTSLLNPNRNRPNLDYEFLGVRRVWRWTEERMHEALEKGLIHQSGPGKVPRFKRYLDEQRGMPLDDVWDDIQPLSSHAQERLGYPTQKPLALLERIISLTTRPGDVVLDPFCGCGTSLHAAHQMGRGWLGIDVAVQAMRVVQDRLVNEFPSISFGVYGIPQSADAARYLAGKHPFKFEEWAVAAVGGMHSGKYRGDGGIDGTFFWKGQSDEKSRGIVSVKGGRSLNPGMIRDLVGTLERERKYTDDPNAIAVFLCAHTPSKGMIEEARKAGFVNTSTMRVPSVQILSVDDIFDGKAILVPALFDTVSASAAGRGSGKASQFKDPREIQRQRAMFFSLKGGKSDPVHEVMPKRVEKVA